MVVIVLEGGGGGGVRHHNPNPSPVRVIWTAAENQEFEPLPGSVGLESSPKSV